jgi:hypothetical protein
MGVAVGAGGSQIYAAWNTNNLQAKGSSLSPLSLTPGSVILISILLLKGRDFLD